MAVTKEKLTILLQDRLGTSRQESRQLVERFFQIMRDNLTRGEDLLISGFGKFWVRQKKARRGRNPQTKENLTISARKVVVFKASRVLRQHLSGQKAWRE
jgi:integration host factor subunit alpha